MYNHTKEISKLNKQCEDAINVFTSTIKSLEQATAQQEAVQECISAEVVTLNQTAAEVNQRIEANKRIIDKMKALLG